MPRTLENLAKHEFIGLEVEVDNHSDVNMEGLSGVVVDETQSFLKIETEKDVKMVEKKEGSFVFELDDTKVRILGELISKRPEERVKMRLPGKWESL